MKRVQPLFAWLVLVSVAWASLIDCPFAFDLVEDGLVFEIGAGPPHFTQSQPPDHYDPLAPRLGHGTVLVGLQKQLATLEPTEYLCAAPATVVARVFRVLTDSAAPRPPPAA